MTDRERTFIPRQEYSFAHSISEQRLSALEKWITETSGKAAGYNNGWMYLLGFITLLSSAITAFALIWHK